MMSESWGQLSERSDSSRLKDANDLYKKMGGLSPCFIQQMNALVYTI